MRGVQPDHHHHHHHHHHHQLQAMHNNAQPACSSRTASSTSPSSDANFSIQPSPAHLQRLQQQPLQKPSSDQEPPVFLFSRNKAADHHQLQQQQQHNLELQLLPSSSKSHATQASYDQNYATHLKLSIGSSSDNNGSDHAVASSSTTEQQPSAASLEAKRLKEFASEQLKLAMAEKSYAEEARQQAKRQIEMAELEFANAKRIRQQAQAELEKAQSLKEQATKKISATIMQITCQACKHQFQASASASMAPPPCDETSLAISYMSSATTEGEGE